MANLGTVIAPQRIEWTQGDYQNYTGRVNGVVLFEITWSTVRGEGYRLRSTLPDFTRTHIMGTNSNNAKERAESILCRFVEKIGAQFPA